MVVMIVKELRIRQSRPGETISACSVAALYRGSHAIWPLTQRKREVLSRAQHAEISVIRHSALQNHDNIFDERQPQYDRFGNAAYAAVVANPGERMCRFSVRPIDIMAATWRRRGTQ